MASIARIKRKLQGQNFADQTYANTDLRNMSAYRSTWERCQFIQCQMSLADMSISKIFDSDFVDCQLLLGDFTRTEIRRAKFTNCDMDQANFSGAVLEAVDFDRCRLAYARFPEATVRDVTFWRTNLHGADLRYIECHRAKYDEVVLQGAAISVGCQFFNATFDARSSDMFAALVGKSYQDLQKRSAIKAIAGEEAVKLVERLMGEGEQDGG